MKTFRIPHTDLDATRIVYGTWHLGETWDDSPIREDVRARAHRLLSAAVEAGINFIDLADIYTRGKSDTLVGEWLAANPGMREKVILQEKAGIILPDLQTGETARYEFTYDHLVSTVEAALRRLQTDRVEILLLHRPDALVEPEEVARAFDKLEADGKVRYFGVSNHRAHQIELLKKVVRQPLVANQLELNLLHNHLINDGIVANTEPVPYAAAAGTLDYCRLHNITIQAWSPVAQGKIFNPPADAPENIRNVGAVIGQLAEQYNTTQDAIALAWLLRHPAGIQPILGTLKPERIFDSVKADDIELTRMEWYRLFTAARGKPVP